MTKFTDANWDQAVLASDKPVLVDFWAEWCGPCRAMEPMINELAKAYEGKAVVGKLNADENPNVATRYSIRGLPTMLVFKGGELVDRIVGVASKQMLSKMIDNQLQQAGNQ
jgi:thioredoxin 1